MLAAGAPVGMHWAADRQNGPRIARYGSATAKRAVLPAIANMLAEGATPDLEAALVKDLGTTFERELIEVARQCVAFVPARARSARFEQMMTESLLAGPSFTLRGGTREILRGIVAKQMNHA